jgi:hypothetical protein
MMPTQARILEYIAKPRTLLQIAYHCRVWASEALAILHDMEAAGLVTVGSLMVNGLYYRAWAASDQQGQVDATYTPGYDSGQPAPVVRNNRRPCHDRDRMAHEMRRRNMSYPAIARKLGYKSHGSVIEAVRRHEKRLEVSDTRK